MITLTENAVAAVKTALGCRQASGRDLYMGRAASVAAGKQPFLRSGQPPVARKMRKSCATASHSGAVLDPDDVAPAVDIADLETDGLGGAQASGIIAHPVGTAARENARGERKPNGYGRFSPRTCRLVGKHP
ncbi:hypothetical protein GCM10007937_25880 [Mesorhizobium albiziae]|nr:hypothetical protein GCM10007937_25880 [Mesorhizobium albiziae]